MESVLVVGNGEIDTPRFERLGRRVVEHWLKAGPDRLNIPNTIDRVVILSDKADVRSVQAIQAECQKNLVPLVFVKSTLDNFEEGIKCSEQKLEVVACSQTQIEKESTMNAEPQQDGRATGKNHERFLAKMAYLEELLQKNPMAQVGELNTKLASKFGGGVAPTAIHQVRWEKFGIKFGPRGKVIQKDGQAAPTPQKKRAKEPSVQPQPQTTPEPQGEIPRSDRLTQLLTELRKEMEVTGVRKLQIPRIGAAQVTYEVTRNVELH
jgi:hypothetical protein